MRGFTGDYYNGLPVFIREEYEEAHYHEEEKERLGELLDATFSMLGIALDTAYHTNQALLYRRYNEQLDAQLRGYEDWELCWLPYKNGYVHKVTGEYVIGYKPNRDSMPCWCYAVPKRYPSAGEVYFDRMVDNLSNLAVGILAIFGGLISTDDLDGKYEEDSNDYD